MKKLSPIIAIVMVFAMLLPLYAQQHDFVDTQPNGQFANPPGAYTPSFPEHWVYNNIYLYAMFNQNNAFKWAANTSIQGDVTTAIARWNAEIPTDVDPAQYTSDPFQAQAFFFEQVCPNPNLPACTTPTQWNSVGGLNVNLWTKMNVYIQPDNILMPGVNFYRFWWTAAGRRGALTHEVGHLWGLGEQYNSNGGCNSNSFAVMDALKADLIEGAYYLSPCDTENVQAASDKMRFWYYFLGNGYDFLEYVNAPGYLTGRWKDAVWMDWGQQYYFYYGSNPSGPWTFYTYVGTTTDGGSHRFVADASNRILQATINNPPGGRYWLVCSKPQFSPSTGGFGDWRCAPFAAYRS